MRSNHPGPPHILPTACAVQTVRFLQSSRAGSIRASSSTAIVGRLFGANVFQWTRGRLKLSDVRGVLQCRTARGSLPNVQGETACCHLGDSELMDWCCIPSQCKDCSFCAAACESGIAGDSRLRGCSSVCDAGQATAYCSLCKCRGCDFCNADGSPSGGTALAPPDGTCVPFNNKDIDHSACLEHCTESQKATHCETCKCKVCGALCNAHPPCCMRSCA